MAASTGFNPYKRDLPTAFDAIRKLLADGHDTEQVFRIMRALNGPACLRTTAGC